MSVWSSKKEVVHVGQRLRMPCYASTFLLPLCAPSVGQHVGQGSLDGSQGFHISKSQKRCNGLKNQCLSHLPHKK